MGKLTSAVRVLFMLGELVVKTDFRTDYVRLIHQVQSCPYCAKMHYCDQHERKRNEVIEYHSRVADTDG